MRGRLLVVALLLQGAKALVVDLLTLPTPDNCSLLLNNLEELLANSVGPLEQEQGEQWQIEVRLPRSWDFSQCGGHRVSSYRQTVNRAHIQVVEGSGPPYSLQHGGCRERGLHLVIPTEILNHPTDKRILEVKNQWHRFANGEFSDHGYPKDTLYPVTMANSSEYVNSKQSLLCGATNSTPKEMVEDLQNRFGGQRRPGPMFIYSLPGRTTTQYLLVLDQSAQMAKRWSQTRRALHQFIDLLPAGSLLSVVTAGYRAREVLPVSRVTEQNRAGLHGRIPRRVLGDTRSCLSCAIHSLAPSLGENSVMVMISSANSTTQGLAEAVLELDRQQVPVYLAAWPDLNPGYIALAKRGRVYSLMEDVEGLEPRLQLQEILLDVLSRSEGRPVRRLHLETHHGLAFSGAFSFQGEEEAEMRVTLNIHEEDRVEFFEVRDPDGMQRLFSKWEDGMVYLHFSGRLPTGLWTYRAKLYPKNMAVNEEDKGEVWVDVVSSRRVEKEALSVELFTNTGPLIEDTSSLPVRVYAIIKTALAKPVSGALAMVMIHGPAGELQELMLHDDGLANPDITKEDGIYSAYIPSFSAIAGYYSLRLIVFDSREGAFSHPGPASNDCCGSKLYPSSAPSSPLPPFSMVVAGLSLYLGTGFGGDQSPPSRVTNLALTSKDQHSLSVNLAWTSPGGDWDYGTAHKYEIRCHTIEEALSEEKFQSQGISVPTQLVPNPQERGVEESATVSVPWNNERFYFAIVALDKAGHRGAVSNLVSVLVTEEPTTLPLIEIEVEGTQLGNKSDNDGGPGLYIAGGVLSGVVLIILIILIVLIVRKKRKRSMVTSSSSTDDPNFPVSDIKIQKQLAESPPLLHTTLRKSARSTPSAKQRTEQNNYIGTQFDQAPSSSTHTPVDFDRNSPADFLNVPRTPHLSYPAPVPQHSLYTSTPPSIHSQGVLLTCPLTPPSPRILLSWLDTLEPPSRPRQKMLTNGSLVSLRDSPPASDSSKLTGSSSLESSQDEEERMGRSATLGRRVGERYMNHTNQHYGLPYSSVTLGRPRLGRPRENNLFCDVDSRGGEGRRGREEERREMEGERVRSRSLKRTESFV